ncbi:tetratricopeptide repeat protein [Brevundimonas lutea]|uniref:tetratricopeptide repeat protein n=1 Tax=Brevundimonas lutea TaxID=2293980 RepID=UPI000F03898F|nr:tetratricopeptide repeat protein [Brevundimonas lutea]
MVDVFEAVEEDLRSERYKRLARRWLPIVGGLLLLALIAALAWWGYDSWRTRQADEASVQYQAGLEALQEGDAESAEQAFVAVQEFGGAYGALALHQRANLALVDGDAAQALALLDEAADATRDPLLKDAAALKAAYLAMDTDASLADMEARLNPLVEEGRPFRPFAQEALAFSRLKAGQAQPAREALSLLTIGQDVPENVRQRAQAAIDSIDSGLAPALAATLQAMPADGAGAPAAAAPAAPAAAPASVPAAEAPAPAAAQ